MHDFGARTTGAASVTATLPSIIRTACTSAMAPSLSITNGYAWPGQAQRKIIGCK
jgi:hypothetical protein